MTYVKKNENENDKGNDKNMIDDGLEVLSVDDIDRTDRKQKKPKKSAASKVRIGVIVVSAAVFLFAGAQLVNIFLEYKRGEDEYKELDKYVTVDTNIGGDEVEEPTDAAVEATPYIMPYVKANVDFDGLKKINSDVLGWIQFEHVSISYPIVQGDDNEYYLKKTFKKADNKAGSIFMEADNNPKFNDMNTFVYGHNMKNGSMFGLMGQYKKETFYKGREHFWIYTPTADYRYEIFACYEPKEDSDTYRWWSASTDAYAKYLEKAKKNSMYDTGVSVSRDDKIVTLSTCTSKGDNYRFVVQGKLVETIKKK